MQDVGVQRGISDQRWLALELRILPLTGDRKSIRPVSFRPAGNVERHSGSMIPLRVQAKV